MFNAKPAEPVLCEKDIEDKLLESALRWAKEKETVMNTRDGPERWAAGDAARMAQGKILAYAEILNTLRAARSVQR